VQNRISKFVYGGLIGWGLRLAGMLVWAFSFGLGFATRADRLWIPLDRKRKIIGGDGGVFILTFIPALSADSEDYFTAESAEGAEIFNSKKFPLPCTGRGRYLSENL